MNNEQYPIDHSRGYTVIQDASLQRTLMQRVFLWMAIGLGITGLTSLLLFKNVDLLYSIASSRGLFLGLIIAEVALVVFLSARIARMSFMTATALFAAYAVLNGVTLSPIFLVYTAQSIAETFFVTAATFSAMAIYGYITKRDLTSMGNLLFMVLIGLIIASLVNMFVGSSLMSLVISAVGVLVFVGLTAYDVQKIKRLFVNTYEDSDDTKKVAILGALTLYLDFINLFIFLLRFMGRRE
ncbi:Bax inhibitor-1/YccA family protein [Porphyromonas sp. COT-239 OH1446]|uniref:Bax inhibitor-1/YccA family protein n=1 Tax=Porphyromonas sp. COT-239 OH1446 TaxID=1515613 RepID=UPI00068EC1FE|nr:Bax inhibitor-1/YccA family protein [Porphyromonas sp. COT-239 OH1446]